MRKYIFYIILFCYLPMFLFSQEKQTVPIEKWNKLQQENTILEAKNKELLQKLRTIEKQNASLRKDSMLLEKGKENYKEAKENLKKLRLYEKEKALLNDSLEWYASSFVELNIAYEKTKEELEGYTETISQLESELKELKTIVASIENFKELYIEDIINRYQPLLEGSLAEMKPDLFTNLEKETTFIKNEVSIVQLFQQAEFIRQQANYYQEARKLLAGSYKKEKIAQCIINLENCIQTTNNKTQRTELEEISMLLDRYSLSITFFLRMIRNNESSLQLYQGVELSENQKEKCVEEILTRAANREAEITRITYLKPLFDQYITQKTTDPLSDVSDIITLLTNMREE